MTTMSGGTVRAPGCAADPASQYRSDDPREANADEHITQRIIGGEVAVRVTERQLDFGTRGEVSYAV